LEFFCKSLVVGFKLADFVGVTSAFATTLATSFASTFASLCLCSASTIGFSGSKLRLPRLGVSPKACSVRARLMTDMAMSFLLPIPAMVAEV